MRSGLQCFAIFLSLARHCFCLTCYSSDSMRGHFFSNLFESILFDCDFLLFLKTLFSAVLFSTFMRTLNCLSPHYHPFCCCPPFYDNTINSPVVLLLSRRKTMLLFLLLCVHRPLSGNLSLLLTSQNKKQKNNSNTHAVYHHDVVVSLFCL